MKTYYTDYDAGTEMFQLININDPSDVLKFQEGEFLDDEFVPENEIVISDGFAIRKPKSFEVIDIGNGIKLYNLENGSSVVDQSNGRLDEILAFAEKMKLKNHFIGVLERLCWNRPKEIVGYVYSDFAPLSLTFGRYRINDAYMKHELNQLNEAYCGNGGIIYHGPHDNGGDGGAPTFSVSINPDRKPHWSIHT
jgi:hypothetical protein